MSCDLVVAQWKSVAFVSGRRLAVESPIIARLLIPLTPIKRSSCGIGYINHLVLATILKNQDELRGHGSPRAFAPFSTRLLSLPHEEVLELILNPYYPSSGQHCDAVVAQW